MTGSIAQLSEASPWLSIMNGVSMNIVVMTLWITGFLCVLNVVLAIIFRRKLKREILSYYAACVVELAIFVLALLLHFRVLAEVPIPLPAGLPVDRAQIGAALAIGIGLFPAAFWHRTNISDLPKRISEDAKAMKEGNGGVRIRKDGPGEWMN